MATREVYSRESVWIILYNSIHAINSTYANPDGEQAKPTSMRKTGLRVLIVSFKNQVCRTSPGIKPVPVSLPSKQNIVTKLILFLYSLFTIWHGFPFDAEQMRNKETNEEARNVSFTMFQFRQLMVDLSKTNVILKGRWM